MERPHLRALIRNIPKGVTLFFKNPVLAFGFARKLFYEVFMFTSFSDSFRLDRIIGGIQFHLDYSALPREKKYIDFVKRIFFEIKYDIYEVHVRQSIERFLKNGDIFIDVGANVGYFSALGADKVGKTGQVHSFEPTPSPLAQLKNLPKDNPDYTIIVNSVALGEQKGVITADYADVTQGAATSLVPEFMKEHDISSAGMTTMPVIRLDEYLEEKGISPALIKIDVEGYEFPVLKGFEGYLKKNKHRPIIICEIQPSAYPLLGNTPDELFAFMKQYGYTAYDVWTQQKIDNLSAVQKDSGFDIIFK
jgi:FkbM family methyltransferase